MSSTNMRRGRILVGLLVAAVAATTVWFLWGRSTRGESSVLEVAGRIEADEAAVAAKLPGRVREVTVREGDLVAAGDVVALLDDEQVRAREEAARSALAQTEARAARTRRQIPVLEMQLEESRISVDQARLDARGRVDQAEAQAAAAEAALAQAEAAYSQARYDAERLTRLAEEGVEAERTAHQARANAEAQGAAVRAARKQLDAARAAVKTAKASLENIPIREARAGAVEAQIAQARADVEAADADVARARAQLDEAAANRADLTVRAPFDGTVATRAVEPGEVVAAGTPIVTIVDLSKVYLRAFVPEGDIGRVRVGQTARVFLDSAPHEPIDAEVTRVDPEASFTPENTYYREDRVRQVVGVMLELRGAAGFAKPGMPADGQILVEGEAWPEAASKR